MIKRKTHFPRVLILGKDGMVGRVAYQYLQTRFPGSVFGTTRNKKETLLFRAEEADLDLKAIFSGIGKVDYIVNCIGKLRTYPIEGMNGNESEYVRTNALLPHALAGMAEKYKFRLVHISTDAVFSSSVKTVDELTIPSADDVYSASKLLGEPTLPRSLSIRTSFAGFNPKHKAGLFELVLGSKRKMPTGFSNQKWSGCTTLQFARFLEWLMLSTNFEKVREVSRVVHFVPLGPESKYMVLKEIAKLLKSPSTIRKGKGAKVTREMATQYDALLDLTSYGSNLKIALQAVIEFEQQTMKEHI